MALPGGGFDAGGQRRNKLDYGNDLRAQIEANRNRKRVDDDERHGGPNVDFFGQVSPPKQRLPNVAGARIPSPANNRRRPPSRNRPQSAGSEQAGRGGVGTRHAEGGGGRTDGSPSRPRALWEGEAYTLSEQVQEMLISVHSRLTGLEKGAQGEERSVGELKEKLQLVEMDHAAMRAEQKSMATQERILQLERDVTQKIHRHLEHVTSIETDQLSEAMEKVHKMQVKAEEDRKRAESMREESRAQQEIIGDLVERLRVLEERGASFESREMDGFQSMSEHRARLEFRVQELEAALVAVSTRGEQMARDTGDAFKTFVDAKNGEVVGQLQKAVTSLSTQLLQLQQEVTQRGMDLQEMAQSEGKARVRDLSLINETTEDRISMMQRVLEEERVRRDGQAAALGQTIDAMSRSMEESEKAWQEGLKQAMLRVAEDQGKFRGELNELSTRAVTSAEEARNFLEEVVRAEIRGRMQGQQQHAEQILALEEAIKAGHVKGGEVLEAGEFNDEVYTQMRLVQAKTKSQGKAIKALSGEVDAAKLVVHTFEKEIGDELRSHASALKSLEDKLTTELALGLQSARDVASGLESRVSGLEAGRTDILDKIYTQVDANRAKDVERARETMERIEGLQRAVDACVEMCQSDLQDVHEGLESVEQRLDREAEGLEALMERTTRQLTNALDSKLQESMGKAVEDLAGGLKRDIEFTKEDVVRFGEQVKECESRVEGVRRGVEQKVRDVEKEVERAEQQQGNDSQHLRDELRSMREAYVRRLDVIDERVNDAKTEVSRRASEAVHRDQQIDKKVRSLEQQLLHSGAGTVAPSAFSLDSAVQASDEGIISTPVKGAFSRGFSSTAPLPGMGMGMGVGASVGGEVGGGIIGYLQSEIAKLRERLPKEREEVDARVGEIEAAVREDRRRFVEENSALVKRLESVWHESQGNFASLSRRVESDEGAHEASMAEVRTMLERARNELGNDVVDCRESCEMAVKDLRQELEAHHADMEERLGGESGVIAKLNDAMGELEKVSRKCNLVEDASKDAVQRLLERFEQSEDAQEDKDLMMEQRFQSMVMEVSENSADQHERMAKTVELMMGRADELAQTAQMLAIEIKLQDGKALDALEKAAASRKEQGRLVCSIADSHRRDIERVCRDAECGRVLESLVTQIEVVELMRSEATTREEADSRLVAAHKSVVAEIKDGIVPNAVKEQVGEMVSLKLLPVQYEVKKQGALVEEQRVHNEARDKELAQQLGELRESYGAADNRVVALETGASRMAIDLERLEASIGESVEQIRKNVGALGTRTEAEAVLSAVDGMVSRLEYQDERSVLEQNVVKRLAKTEIKISKLDEIVTLLAQGDQDQDANAKALDSLDNMVNELSDKAERLEARMDVLEQDFLDGGSQAAELDTVDEGDEGGSSRGSEALSPSTKGGGRNELEQSIGGDDSADANMWGDADGDAALPGSEQQDDGVRGGGEVGGDQEQDQVEDQDDDPPELPGNGHGDDGEADSHPEAGIGEGDEEGGLDAPPDLPGIEGGGEEAESPPDLPGAQARGENEEEKVDSPPDLPEEGGNEEGGLDAPPDLPGAEGESVEAESPPDLPGAQAGGENEEEKVDSPPDLPSAEVAGEEAGADAPPKLPGV